MMTKKEHVEMMEKIRKRNLKPQPTKVKRKTRSNKNED